MYLVSSFLFALSANIDSFIIGLSCGIRKTRISVPQIILISLITLCGTAAALAAGEELLSFFVFPYAEYAGKFILLLFGLYYVSKAVFMSLLHPFTKHENTKTKPFSSSGKAISAPSLSPETKKETDSHSTSHPLSWKSTFLFGFSLSVNNLGIGLGASISGLRLFPASLISFVASIFFLLLGNHAGRCISFQKSERYADLFCGILLILLGLFC